MKAVFNRITVTTTVKENCNNECNNMDLEHQPRTTDLKIQERESALSSPSNGSMFLYKIIAVLLFPLTAMYYAWLWVRNMQISSERHRDLMVRR